MKSVVFVISAITFFALSLVVQDMSKAVEAYNRGIEFQEKGDKVNALLSYDRAIALNLKMADPYNSRANIKLTNGDTAGAIADYTKAIELSPDNPLSYYNRGNSYLDRNEYDAAIADYTKTINILNGLTNKYDKQAHLLSYNNRGNAFTAKGDLKAAMADYNRALEIQPSCFQAFTG